MICCLLGRDTAAKLGVLQILDPTSVNTVEEKVTSETLFQGHEKCFQGMGKLKDFQLEIPVDESGTTAKTQPLEREREVVEET